MIAAEEGKNRARKRDELKDEEEVPEVRQLTHTFPPSETVLSAGQHQHNVLAKYTGWPKFPCSDCSDFHG
jgi:hypothetical protein